MLDAYNVVSERTRKNFLSGSAIRRMFEDGLRLKSHFGATRVADMSLGNPTFDPPPEFRNALKRTADRAGRHGYMPNAGYPDVRERVASHLRKSFFKDIDASHIVMTTGAAGALNVVLETILDPGHEVIILKPYFPEYRYYVQAHGGVAKFVDTKWDFSLNVEAIERSITKRTKAIIVNTPNNPTGRVYPRRDLEHLAAALVAKERALKTRIVLLSDEPYREIVYGRRRFISPASIYPDSFMCYSWSKAFSIPGERIGYVAVNPEMELDDGDELMGALGMCNRYLGFVNAPAFMQRVISRAVEADVDVGHYREKRDMLCEALDHGGYDFVVPEGAFYIFARTPGAERDFVEQARRDLLLVVPGTDFGRPGHFRLSYAVPDRTVQLACKKLEKLAPHPLSERMNPWPFNY